MAHEEPTQELCIAGRSTSGSTAVSNGSVYTYLDSYGSLQLQRFLSHCELRTS